MSDVSFKEFPRVKSARSKNIDGSLDTTKSQPRNYLSNFSRRAKLPEGKRFSQWILIFFARNADL